LKKSFFTFRSRYIDTTRQEFIPTLAIKEQIMASPISTITSEHLHAGMVIARKLTNRGKHYPELMDA
jgi:hypothetical protein